jgi:hypothetical protein
VASDFSSGADHLPSPPAMPAISHTGRRSSMSIAGECRRLANGLSSHAGNRHSTPEGSWSYGITRSVQCSMISDMNLTLMPSWSAVLAKYRNTDLPGAGCAGCNDGEKVSVWHCNRGRPRSRRTQIVPLLRKVQRQINSAGEKISCLLLLDSLRRVRAAYSVV